MKQPESVENVEDEPIYGNHKYFDDDSMGSIQKCNLSTLILFIIFNRKRIFT